MDFNRLLTKDYLLSTNEKLQFWYLYVVFFVSLIVIAIVVRHRIKKRDDYAAKESFVKQLYWFYLTIGTLGLAATFSRFENLPLFGARIVNFGIIKIFFLSNIWLIYYYMTKTKKETLRLQGVKRKEKWLKKK